MKLVQNEKICQADIQGIMNYKINLNGTKAKPNNTSSMETKTSTTTFSKTDTSTGNDLNKAESSNQLRLVSQFELVFQQPITRLSAFFLHRDLISRKFPQGLPLK